MELLTQIIFEYVSSATCLAWKNVQSDFARAMASNINVSSVGDKLWQTKFEHVTIDWSVVCRNWIDDEELIGD